MQLFTWKKNGDCFFFLTATDAVATSCIIVPCAFSVPFEHVVYLHSGGHDARGVLFYHIQFIYGSDMEYWCKVSRNG